MTVRQLTPLAREQRRNTEPWPRSALSPRVSRATPAADPRGSSLRSRRRRRTVVQLVYVHAQKGHAEKSPARSSRIGLRRRRGWLIVASEGPDARPLCRTLLADVEIPSLTRSRSPKRGAFSRGSRRGCGGCAADAAGVPRLPPPPVLGRRLASVGGVRVAVAGSRSPTRAPLRATLVPLGRLRRAEVPGAKRTVELLPETVRVLRALQPLHLTPEMPVFTTTTGAPIEPKPFPSTGIAVSGPSVSACGASTARRIPS